MFKFYPENFETGKPRANINTDDMHIGSIYLHCQIQTENGFDLGYFDPAQLPAEDGIYDVEVIVENNNIIPCKLYFWYPLRNGQRQAIYHIITGDLMDYLYKGLIVKLDDRAGHAHAYQKYQKKPEWL